jgi:Protein of unknown function (DUF642)
VTCFNDRVVGSEKIFMKKLALCGISIWTMAIGMPAMANLIFNGDFEDGTFAPNNPAGEMVLLNGSTAIAGWVVNGGGGAAGDITWESNANAWGVLTPNGDKFLELTGYFNDRNNPHGGITVSATQSVNTIAGTQYVLTFDMGSSQHYDQNYPNIGNPQIMVTVNGTPTSYTTTDGDISAPDTDGFMHWQAESFTFVASGPQTSLSFLAVTPGLDDVIGLDHVGLNAADPPQDPPAVPESNTAIAAALLLLPFGVGLFRAMRKKRSS